MSKDARSLYPPCLSLVDLASRKSAQVRDLKRNFIKYFKICQGIVHNLSSDRTLLTRADSEYYIIE